MHTLEPTTTLERDALGRVTVTKARREALLDEFERSGSRDCLSRGSWARTINPLPRGFKSAAMHADSILN